MASLAEQIAAANSTETWEEQRREVSAERWEKLADKRARTQAACAKALEECRANPRIRRVLDLQTLTLEERNLVDTRVIAYGS